VQQIQGQYDLSLIYELKCFLILEKVLPPDHEDIGKSLSSIGKCYNQLNLALEYYKRAFIFYESLPYWHKDRNNVELKMKQLFIKIEEMNI
jgi:hypothetical protein